jgi:hypothetical protein
MAKYGFTKKQALTKMPFFVSSHLWRQEQLTFGVCVHFLEVVLHPDEEVGQELVAFLPALHDLVSGGIAQDFLN